RREVARPRGAVRRAHHPARDRARGLRRRARRGDGRMTVLVTAASRHGGTAEIAAAIGRVLRERGVVADVVPVEDVDSLAEYDAVVLGSGVYVGRWLESARTFVDRHGNDLAARPVWLFSSGPIEGKGDAAAGAIVRGSRSPSARSCAPSGPGRATTATGGRFAATHRRSRRRSAREDTPRLGGHDELLARGDHLHAEVAEEPDAVHDSLADGIRVLADAP